jgi:hypothetical protein
VKYLLFNHSNYEKFPFIDVKEYEHECCCGWEAIASKINQYSVSLKKVKSL